MYIKIKYFFIFLKVAVERLNEILPFPPLPTSLGLAPNGGMESCQCVVFVGFFLAGDVSFLSCQDGCALFREG
jgi:hypothetical protein